jgi:molybdate transport system substrate-binding protein
MRVPANGCQLSPSVLGVWRLVLLLFLCASFSNRVVGQEQLTIAAAADLQPVMTVIAAQFEQETQTPVRLTFGSSGSFFSQIENGAPFDVFFSADMNYPQKLQADGVTAGPPTPYAVGKIVLWAPNKSTVQVSKGLSVLADNNVRKIAIANPIHAPYGEAAKAALQKLALWHAISPKLVIGENISQAAQFVQSGNADVGILALSLVLAPGMKGQGSYFEIPQELYPLLQQASVILKSSSHKEQAQDFTAFMKRPQSIILLKQYGFQVSEANSK